MKKSRKDPFAAVDAAIEAVQAALKKRFGKGAVTTFRDGARSVVREVIPTGIPVLDHYVLGCGGLPVGRASEVYSDEGGGKTTYALHCLGAVQRLGGLGILADDEEAMNEERARVMGVDVGRLLIEQPATLEQSLDMQYAALLSIPDGVGPNLLVWDSLAASPPQCELEGAAADVSVGERARIMGRVVPKIAKLLQRKRAHWLIVNQTRQKIGVVFGDATTTPGGKVLKFHVSQRMQLFPGKSLKDSAKQHVGKTITFLGTKNRFAPPYRKARVRLMFAHGFELEWCVVDHAKNLGALPAGTKVSDGLPRALTHFEEHGWDAAVDRKKEKVAPDEVEEEQDDGLEG